MGLFSSSKKTVVDYSLSPLKEEEFIKKSMPAAIVKAVLGNSSISNEIILNALAGTVTSTKGFYRKSIKRHDTYINLTRFDLGDAEVIELILNDTGNVVDTLLSTDIGTFNPIDYLYYFLDYNFSNDTINDSRLTGGDGDDYYLDDIAVEETANEEVDNFSIESYTYDYTIDVHRDKYQTKTKTTHYYVYSTGTVTVDEEPVITCYYRIGTSTTPIYEFRPNAEGIDVIGTESTISWSNWTETSCPVGGNTESSSTATLPNPVFIEQVDEQLTYSRTIPYNDVSVRLLTARYTTDTGEYIYMSTLGVDILEEFENERNSIRISDNDFIGAVPIRVDFTSYTKDNVNYKESNRNAKKLGIPIQPILESIAVDGEGNPNGDLDKMKDIFITLALSVDEVDIPSLKYMYTFFDYFYTVHECDGGNFNSSRAYYRILYWQDKFMHTLVFNKIEKTTINGSIGSIGTYTSVIDTTTNVWGVTEDEYGDTHLSIIKRHGILTINYQNTLNTYIELKCIGLQEEVFVMSVGTSDRGRVAYIELGNTDNKICIPILYSLLLKPGSNFNYGEKEIVILRSMKLAINAQQTHTVKWYQQAWFSTFMLFATVVLAAYTLGASLAATAPLTGTAAFLVSAGVSSIVLAKVLAFVIHAVVLRKLLEAGLEATDNRFLEAVLTVAYVYVQFVYGSPAEASSLFMAAHGVDIANTVVTTTAKDRLNEYKDELGIDEKERKLKELQDEINSYGYNANALLAAVVKDAAIYSPEYNESITASIVNPIEYFARRYVADSLILVR